jgi:hypothetical protein
METFVEQLMQIIDSPEYGDCIWWNSPGNGFLLAPKKFTEKVVKKYFQGTKFESFTRKLNRWGFKRVMKGGSPAGVLMYRHDLFQSGKPELLKKMRTITNEQRKEMIRDHQMSTCQPAMHRFLLSEPAFEQWPGVANAGSSLTNVLRGLCRPSSTFLADRSSNRQEVNQHQSNAEKLTILRRLQGLPASSTMSSSIFVDRTLGDQQQANRVEPSAVLREMHRLEEDRNAMLIAAGLRHRLLHGQREELIGVTPSFRSSFPANVLASRILQAASQVPPSAAPEAAGLRLGYNLLNSIKPFSSVGVGFRQGAHQLQTTNAKHLPLFRSNGETETVNRFLAQEVPQYP